MIDHNMPKSTKKTQAVTATPTVNVEVLSADSNKSASKPKVSKSKPVKSLDVTPTTVETTATTNTVVYENESSESILTDTFTEFMAKLQNLASQMNSLKSEFRTLEKKAVRELKTAQKINAKRKRKTGNRSPSGFVKPTLISNELANFLKKPHGTEMARTEVTREINGYIRANSLQDKENGRKINPDSHLATLLKINAGEELTYFNLQRYMSPHFAKANSKVPAVDM